MLGALASMYWEAPMTVKNGRELGPTFISTRGVKQGDPLSPLLFGLFIDRLEGWLKQRLPDCGVQLGEQLVQLLLYADDLTLVASSPGELQQLLDCLQDFCLEYQMVVNVSKCATVVFGRSRPARGRDFPVEGWAYDGQPVPHASEFKYLGIVFHETKGVSACVEALQSAGLRAMWGMLGRCGDMELSSIEVQVQLFDSLVAPILGYCAEVWAPTLLRGASDPLRCMDNSLHKVQTLFMRRLGGGLRRSTPRQLMLREFGCRPLVRGWLLSCIRLWNRVREMPEDSWMRTALLESTTLGSEAGHSWLSDFQALLSKFGALPENGLFVDGLPLTLPAPSVVAKFDEWFYSCWCALPDDPRTAPSDRVLCCTYQQWFAGEGGPCEPLTALDSGRWSDCPDYVRHTAGISRECVRSLAGFRLSAHDLDVATAKWTRPARAPHGSPAPSDAASVRASRLCRLCQQGVGDELHVVAECEAYTAIRQSHADLFVEFGGWLQFPRHDMSNTQFREFMQQPQPQVASFLHACWQRRWQTPPNDVVFAECLPPPLVAPAGSEEASQFFSACSEFYEFYDACSDFSDDFYDVSSAP